MEFWNSQPQRKHWPFTTSRIFQMLIGNTTVNKTSQEVSILPGRQITSELVNKWCVGWCMPYLIPFHSPLHALPHCLFTCFLWLIILLIQPQWAKASHKKQAPGLTTGQAHVPLPGVGGRCSWVQTLPLQFWAWVLSPYHYKREEKARITI